MPQLQPVFGVLVAAERDYLSSSSLSSSPPLDSIELVRVMRRNSSSSTCIPPDDRSPITGRMVTVHIKILSAWIGISVTGVASFFLARKYVEQNRKEAMLARERVNFKIEEELIQIRTKQLQALEAYRQAKIEEKEKDSKKQ